MMCPSLELNLIYTFPRFEDNFLKSKLQHGAELGYD